MSSSLFVVIDVHSGQLNEESAHVAGRIGQHLKSFDAEELSNVCFFAIGESDVEFPPELAPYVTEQNLYRKKGSSVLENPDFQKRLQSAGTTPVQICGVDTDACIVSAAFGITAEGFGVEVLRDLCASSGGEGEHNIGLIMIAQGLGRDAVR